MARPVARRRVVCICGGGSLAHALAAVVGALPEAEVRVMSRQPGRWGRRVRAIYLDRAEVVGAVAAATDDPACLADADAVLLAVPQIAVDEWLDRIARHAPASAWVVALPGYGGIDWRARARLGPERRFAGLQRVPYVRRTIAYGEAVWISGIRPRLYVAVPGGRADATADAVRLVGELLGMPVSGLASYLPINLTTTNPTFHPARLHALFAGEAGSRCSDPPPQFYADWDDAASRAFCRLDAEMAAILRGLGEDPSMLMDLKRHYGTRQPTALTGVIRRIAALRDRPVPVRPTPERGWVLDRHCPYVTEDIPFGLAPIAALAEVAGVDAPFTRAVLAWADRLLDDSLFDPAGQLRRDGRFPHPAAYGLLSPAAVRNAARSDAGSGPAEGVDASIS